MGRMRCSTDIPGDKFFDGVHKAIEQLFDVRYCLAAECPLSGVKQT